MRFPALPSGEYALDIEVEGFPCATRVELLVDVLNVLNDTAEEGDVGIHSGTSQPQSYAQAGCRDTRAIADDSSCLARLGWTNLVSRRTCVIRLA